MKTKKKIIAFFVFLISAMFFCITVNAQQVSNDDELEQALKDGSVTKIEIAYKDPVIDENITLNRGVNIDGGGYKLSSSNGASIRCAEGTTLSISNLAFEGKQNFIIKAAGTVNLNGSIGFCSGYGILLEKGSTLSAAAATAYTEKDSVVAIGVDCIAGTVQISGLNLTADNGTGHLVYVYSEYGTLVFSGKNVLSTSFGKGICCNADEKANQTVKISSGAEVYVEAKNGKSGNIYCAALDIRACDLKMEKGSKLTLIGTNSGLTCSTINTAENCTLIASSNITGGNITQGYHAGAVTIAGSGKSNFGETNNISVSGKNGLLVLAGQSVSFGKNSSINASIDSGDGLCAYKGKFVYGEGCSVKIKAEGRCIYSKGDFNCNNYCEFLLDPIAKKNQGGIYTEGKFTASDYSVIKVKGADTKRCAVYAPGSVLFGNYCTFEADTCATGICTNCGIETGTDCVFNITGSDYCGIYSLGTLTTDRVNFGKNSTINIDAESSAVYTCEALCLENGCKATFSAGNTAPAIWISTTSTQQGYIRFTGSDVTVRSRLNAMERGDPAVRCVGTFIAENNTKVDIITDSAFAVICTAGDLVVGVGSRLRAYGGCAVLVDDGNVRVIQGGCLETHGYLDSGIRVNNGMLRVAEKGTLISQGERYGAEMLHNSSIWLESPEYYDIRSTKANAIYIEDGVFSVSETKAVSCWYPQKGKSNTETWWSTDTSKLYAWETRDKVSADDLTYADYTVYNATGKLTFTNARQISSSGLDSNISSCSALANRISMYKTRPIAQSNYMFIPAGRSFSWQLGAVTTDGKPGKFMLSNAIGKGSADITEKGVMTYAAFDDTRGEQVFEFTVEGSDGAVSLPGKLTINVTRSKPPAAYNASFNVIVNGSLSAVVTATDFDGSIAKLEVTEKPEYGKVTIGTDGTFKYTPEQSFIGVDSFSYIATDNDGDVSTPAKVTLFVGMDNNYCAYNKTYIAAKNEATHGKFGFRVPKGGNVQYITVTELPEYGTVTCSGSDFIYEPPLDYAGTQVIAFNVRDGAGNVSNTGYISIITVPSQKPVANSMKVDCISGRTFEGKLSADDLDGTVKAFISDRLPENGELEIDREKGTFTYKPDPSFTGADSFSFYVYDDEGLESQTAEVMISVETLVKHLETTGQLSKIVIFSLLGAVVFIALIVFIVVANERRKRKLDMEYEEQFIQNVEDDYNDFGF